MSTIFVGGPCAERQLEIGARELKAAPANHQIPDVGTLAAGREGTAVRLRALAEMALVNGDARFVHVESDDGTFTANIAIKEALQGGFVLYAHEGGELPRSLGGPFRLLFADSEECSINVKFLGRVEFVETPGTHTATC